MTAKSSRARSRARQGRQNYGRANHGRRSYGRSGRSSHTAMWIIFWVGLFLFAAANDWITLSGK